MNLSVQYNVLRKQMVATVNVSVFFSFGIEIVKINVSAKYNQYISKSEF